MRGSITGAIAILFLSVVVFPPLASVDSVSIKASEASKYIGQKKTVCGTVVSAVFAIQSRGQPTFLNLDKPYPDHLFTVVIWGSNRSRFPQPPEKAFRDKRICASGSITMYKNKPQIIVDLPTQIQVKGR